MGSCPALYITKKGAFDSQPQVIKFTSYLPMVGGSLRVLQLLPPLQLVAMILLKVALNTKIQIQILFWTQSEDVCFGDQSEDVCLETQSENVCFGDTISGRLLWRPIGGRLLLIFFWRCNQRTSFSDTEQRTYFLEELYSAVLKLCSTFMLRGSLYGLYQLVKC